MTRPRPPDPPHKVAESADYIVTNTKGTNGQPDNVDRDQYWNTDAQKDNAAVLLNYAGLPDAAKNAESSFKDGNYEIHITMSDQGGAVDRTAGKVRVANWQRTVNVVAGGVDPPAGATVKLYADDNTPYVPALKPEAVIAVTTPKLAAGAAVGVKGEQYYPNLLMDVYIVPHKAAGWMESDSLSAGAVKRIVVQSDGNGVVPLTQAWTAQAGEYDVVIDYDNDGKFSWTLDGVSGFRVDAPGSVGNRVWSDAVYAYDTYAPVPNPLPTGNGVQNAGEAGFPGIVVHLQDASGQEVAVTTTGQSGGYSFGNIAPGTYRIKFDRLPDLDGVYGWVRYRFTVRDALGSSAPESDLDSDADDSGLTDWFTVAPGQDVTSIDAGIVTNETEQILIGGGPPGARSSAGANAVSIDAALLRDKSGPARRWREVVTPGGSVVSVLSEA